MKLSALLSTILLTASCVQATKEASVSGGSMTTSAPGIWIGEKTSFPKTLHISNDFSNDENDQIEDMLDAWESSLENKFDFFTVGNRVSDISDNVSSLKSLNDNIFAVYKMNNWPSEFGSTALAVTQIFGRGYNQGTNSAYNVIYHADIIVNNTKTFRLNNTDPGFDFRTVVLHEIGHFLGLNHVTDVSKRNLSVMYGYINDSDEKRVPLTMDIQAIADKYTIAPGPSSVWTASAHSVSPYRPLNNDPGEEIHLILELHENGDCVHKLNGAEVMRHSVDLKKN